MVTWCSSRFTRLPSLQLVKTAELDPPGTTSLATTLMELQLLELTNLCTDGTGFPSLFPGICSSDDAELVVLGPCLQGLYHNRR